MRVVTFSRGWPLSCSTWPASAVTPGGACRGSSACQGKMGLPVAALPRPLLRIWRGLLARACWLCRGSARGQRRGRGARCLAVGRREPDGREGQQEVGGIGSAVQGQHIGGAGPEWRLRGDEEQPAALGGDDGYLRCASVLTYATTSRICSSERW